MKEPFEMSTERPPFGDNGYASFHRATSDMQRLQRGGTAILDQPETPPAVWGRGKLVAWPCGQATMIASHQGLGKSTLAQQLLLHRIGLREGEFLGMPVTSLPPDRRVLYLAMDRPMQITQSMRRMVGEQHRQVLDQRLDIWPGPLPYKLVDDPRRMADWVQEICPDVGDVIVDSVKDLAAGISSDDVGAAVNLAWQEIIARGIELLLLHHQRKAQQGTTRLNTLDDVYGSTWLTSGLGSVFTLAGEPGGRLVTIKHVKPVVQQLDDLDVQHDHQTGTTTLDETKRVDLLEAVRSAGSEGITAVDAAQATLGAAGDREQKKIRGQLNKLVSNGQAEKLPGKRTSAGAEPHRWCIAAGLEWAESLS